MEVIMMMNQTTY